MERTSIDLVFKDKTTFNIPECAISNILFGNERLKRLFKPKRRVWFYGYIQLELDKSKLDEIKIDGIIRRKNLFLIRENYSDRQVKEYYTAWNNNSKKVNSFQNNEIDLFWVRISIVEREIY